MNIKSLLEAITSNTATTAKTTTNYEVDDRSFLTELLSGTHQTRIENRSDCEILGITPFFDFRKTDKFPVTLFIFRTLWKLMMLLPLCYYKIVSLLAWAFSNRQEKFQSKINSARVNFVMFFCSIVLAIVLLVSTFFFFFNSVLLLDSNQLINDYGTIHMEQPCGIESCVYLYNTAQPWTNTGINIVKGDEVRISASGAFYGRVFDLVNSANKNDTLPFSFINPSVKDSSQSLRLPNLVELCMYNKKDAVFGSLLYQIKKDNETIIYDSRDDNDDNPHIIQDNHERGESFSFTARHSGELYVSINDIYLSDKVLVLLRDMPNDNIKNHLEIEKINDTTKIKSNVLFNRGLNWVKERESKDASDTIDTMVEKKLAKLYALVHSDSLFRKYWFDDNLGEILLNITVNRNVISSSNVGGSFMSHAYRRIDKFFDKKWEEILFHVSIFLLIITFLLYCDHKFMHEK